MSKNPEKKWKLSPKARVVPKAERHQVPAEAFEDRNTKVRVTMYIDLDVVEFFKAGAAKGGTPYQTQINAALRDVLAMQQAHDPATQLRQAKNLIDAAMRKIS